MSGGLVTAAYIVAAILFIFSLAGLSKHETSRQGNNFGIAGMAIALLATIFGPDTGNVAWILVAMIIGGAIGIRMAKKVENDRDAGAGRDSAQFRGPGSGTGWF